MRRKGKESMCNLVLTFEAYRAFESCKRLSSFARLLNVRVSYLLKHVLIRGYTVTFNIIYWKEEIFYRAF